MNWDYVRGKKTKRKIKINKQKGNKQKKINKKKLKKFLYDSLVLYLTKKMVKSVIYLLFSYQTGYIMSYYGFSLLNNFSLVIQP